MNDSVAILKRIDKSGMGSANKRQIRAFLSHIKNREELTDSRLYFYGNYLKSIAEIMGPKFLEPNDSDVENVLNQVRKSELSEWTIENYKTTLKKFYSWLLKEEKPACVSWIKRNNRPNYKRKPDFRITPEEVDILIQSASNARDKAIFSLLYDSGIRIGELLTLRIKDVTFDEAGMKVFVSGKTGPRPVRVIGDSVGYVKQWLNVHPDMFNEDAWVFCGIGYNMSGASTLKEPMNHDQIYRMFGKTKRRAVKLGFPENKRIYPHKFRHNRATELTPKITASILEKQMGWVPGSRQRAVYEHLNPEDVDNAILEAHGIKVNKKKIEVRKARVCMNCKTPNPSNGVYCLQCGRPLNYDEARTLKEDQERATEILEDNELLTGSEKILFDELKGNPELMSDLLRVIIKRLRSEGKTPEEIMESRRARD